MFGKNRDTALARIADALERIADRLEYGNELQENTFAPGETALPQASPAPAAAAPARPKVLTPTPHAPPVVVPSTRRAPEEGAELGDQLGKIAEYLTSHGLLITEPIREDPLVPYRYAKEAAYLGNRYAELAFLLPHLRRIAPTGEGAILDVSFAEQEQLVYITQFCYILQGAEILSVYQYDKLSKRITVAVNADNEGGLDFLAGAWLPHALTLTARRVAANEYRTHRLPIRRYVFARETAVKALQGGEEAKLGLLAYFCGEVFLIACETRLAADRVAKHGSFAKKYGFDKSRSFLVMLEGDDETLQGWENLYDNIQLCSFSAFEERFAEALRTTIRQAGGTVFLEA
ncbi:MAG: hypothetical protein LBN05_02465 [Oscillospiraceae bacterium]|jgi:hypothetical protein|nr:hypothetical protein [Oscillospiraceae bacterium]